MIDIGELRRTARFRRSELALALATAVAVVALGVLWASLPRSRCPVPICCGAIARPHDALLGYLPGQATNAHVHDRLDGRQVPAW